MVGINARIIDGKRTLDRFLSIAIAKTIVILQKRVQLAKLLEALERKPFLPDLGRGGDVEVKLVNKCVWITYLQSTVYWILLFLTMGFSVAITLIRRMKSSDPQDWQYPYGPITIINVTYSPNFEIILAYQVISMSCYAGYFCTNDLLVAAALVHISCQFKILQHSIRNVVKFCYKEMLKETNIVETEDFNYNTSSIPFKYLKKGLERVVEYHLAIIKIAEELENIFSGLLLVVFISTLAMVSLISFSDSRIFVAFGELLLGLGQTILICFWGEQVINESQLVANAVFDMDFVGTDVRFQKGLILIMQRSQKPVTLTANRYAHEM
ncbi:hypothetical protein ILUMI_18819 [Ignelater luminosus]|uniref:Uncharacterized protein n=1 Tax=Ignelater luminosus TaxID=2038154 RepID=A0A8K0G614_IGNLU|nr:hypothetical protein ILUMI_18819 [Ignelater luminosus]